VTLSEVVTVTIANDARSFPCASGDTILRAGLRAGIGLSYECNTGSCGTCKIDLLGGEVHDLYPDAPGIKQRDRDRGRRLACQSVPRGPCTIKSRISAEYLTADAPMRRIASLQATRQITHDIREFLFKAAGAAKFLAGQYAMLNVDGAPAPRAYSMSNTGNEEGLWKFMIRRTPDGVVSNALFYLTPGANVELDGPFGLAFLREESQRDIVCIAGGSGISPMVSILDAAAQHKTLAQRDAWLFYGGRGPADVPQLDELLVHRLEGRALQWHPVISVPALAEGTDWVGETGFVHELLPRRLPKPLTEYEYYLAGPPPMVEATIRLLVAENNVPQSQLHFDRFF
jgi:toluene monooxygenase electron transfer component